MREFGLLDFAFNADSDRDRCMEIKETKHPISTCSMHRSVQEKR